MPLREVESYAIVWQDSLLFLCFDKIPVTKPIITAEDLRDNLPLTIHFLYDRTIRSSSLWASYESPDLAVILGDVCSIEQIRSKIIALNGRPQQFNIAQRRETSILNLHISFVTAWLCRPVLRSHDPTTRTSTHSQLIEKCYQNLVECVRAFVKLYSMSVITSRSWSIMHNGLSSALLLGLLGGTPRDTEMRDLQAKILEIFSESQDDTAGSNLKTNSQLSPPYARVIVAFRRLYTDHESNTLHTGGHAAPESVNVGRFTNVAIGA
ncbi:hypothetical protein BTUL_0135g00040 [Botrytis tulipae]|uniref:Transcription factor domain-containing protein n=1 Tax=Botrytis tulipae TaxID=87230 RepID=A0A4Z1EM94_9HELO|nr:hypothetical protein BTUL_0135g00040 [Botrytis tulipae]